MATILGVQVGPSTPAQLNKGSKRSSDALDNGIEDSSRSHTTSGTPASGSNNSTPLSSPPASPSPQQVNSSTMDQPAAKKRKFTFQEKEDEKALKLVEAQQKAEAKQKKLEEKQQKEKEKAEDKARKDEEKRVKEAEKEKARLVKEEEKRVKEEEKAKKLEEKERKDQEKKAKEAKALAAQSRITSFVKRKESKSPAPTSRSEPTPEDGLTKHFPPFMVWPGISLAPSNRFLKDKSQLERAQREIDEVIHGESKPTDVQSVFKSSKTNRYRNQRASVRQLVNRINGSEENPITIDDSKPRDSLSLVSLKYLKFYEDVRPAYCGTFTKQPSNCSVKKLSRNPSVHAFGLEEGFEYDYDSEAEWEEPEAEDEELRSEDEDEEEDDDDDMEDFLDDGQEDKPVKGKLIEGQTPLNTGLVWSGSPLNSVPYGDSTIDLSSLRIAPLMVSAMGPIDPFSTKYWNPPSSEMPPPPVPVSIFSKLGTPQAASLPLQTKATAGAKPLPPELLDEFKNAVDGSDLTQIGIVEILKKKFPKVTKKTIQATLEQVAKREGSTQQDKKWVLR